VIFQHFVARWGADVGEKVRAAATRIHTGRGNPLDMEERLAAALGEQCLPLCYRLSVEQASPATHHPLIEKL
jgi:hypothetical protein